MSEPVEPSLPSETHLTPPDTGKAEGEGKRTEGTDAAVTASIDSTSNELVEAEHAVDIVQLSRIFEAALLTSQEPLSITELKRLSDVPLETKFVEELLQQALG